MDLTVGAAVGRWRSYQKRARQSSLGPGLARILVESGIANLGEGSIDREVETSANGYGVATTTMRRTPTTRLAVELGLGK